MYGINWPQLVSGFIMIVTMIYYIITLSRTEEGYKNAYLFSRSSQLTFAAFVFGMAILIVRATVAHSVSLDWLLYFGAAITTVNALGIMFYKHRDK